MTIKNTRISVAALITGLMATLIAGLMSLSLTPTPSKAQSAAQAGDVLQILSIKCVDITNDEGFGPFGDDADEPYITVDGNQVWSGQMRNGQDQSVGASATLSGQSARVQLWERDPGAINSPNDGPAEFFADYTGGDERTRTLTLNGGVYEITYVVDRDVPPQPTPPVILPPLKPAPDSLIRDRTPLISAVVRDADSELTRDNITLKVDGVSKPFFSYDQATDKLTYQSGRLSYGKHNVTVEVRDAQGLEADQTWSFKVIKKRR